MPGHLLVYIGTYTWYVCMYCFMYSELLNYVLTFWTVVMNILLLVAWESVDLKM